jgi:hypothetical protein
VAFNPTADQTGPLIALSDAARLCYHSIISTRTRVFSRAPESDDYALVWPNEIMEGTLGLGGAYLEFSDGRPTLSYLSVLRSEIPRLCHELRDAFGEPPS